MAAADFDKNDLEEMERICDAPFIPWERFYGKHILITGATGLIGYTLTNVLLYVSQKRRLEMTVLALVRDEARARERFSQWDSLFGKALCFISGNVEHLPEILPPVDYIIHGASQTASRAFVEQPVETIRTALAGTEKLLELAKEKNVLGFAYLSSMEVYGHPAKGHKVAEWEIGAISPLNLRNSYSVSKLMCENLCCAYAAQYHVPAAIVRLTQTFGPGVNYSDSRVFAQFARCVIEKKDIVLKTKGETERSYLYTADAASAVLTVLLKGKAGQAYNAADESTYCSIAQMAQRIAEMGGIGVRYEIEDTRKNGYPETLYMDLDTGLLKQLGWSVLFPEPVCGGYLRGGGIKRCRA